MKVIDLVTIPAYLVMVTIRPEVTYSIFVNTVASPNRIVGLQIDLRLKRSRDVEMKI